MEMSSSSDSSPSSRSKLPLQETPTDDNNSSLISDLSESPYKKLTEKELLFKILDKHQSAMMDKKKRQAYLHKQGFLRGVLNNQGLVWEMRNVSTRASNYASVALIKEAYQDNEHY